MNPPAKISLRGVTLRYPGGRPVLDNLDLEIGTGELCVLLGASGCGKTTTLKLVHRLLEPNSGRIRLDGEPIESLDPIALRRRIGYVFQGVGLFPHWTVAENIGIVPRLLGWSPDRIEARVEEWLDRVHLDRGLALRSPRELSGGQQQRVGVARALAAGPGVLLLDEPFGALDPVTRAALQDELLSIHRGLGLTTLLVTHDIVEALRLGDRIAVMEKGRIAAIGTPPELIGSPERAVASLMRVPREQAAELSRLLDGGRG